MCLPIAMACASMGSLAHAQAVAGSSTPPLAPPALSPGGYAAPQAPVPQGVGVADRPRIEYLPIGGRIGSFFLYPDAEVTGGATDNLRAVDTQKMSDTYVRLRGGAQLVSGFSRHSLRMGAFVSRPFYANNPREGVTQFGGSIDGRLDVDTFTQVNLTLTGARSVVDRTDYNSPYGAVSPIAFDRLSARLGVTHVFNRLAVTAQGKVTGLTYHDGLSDAGAVIDQSYRNQTVTSALLDTRYNLTTGFDLLLHGTYERQDFANANALASGALLRNSSGWVVEGGTRLNLTGSLYGEVRVGYLWRSYADPRLLNARGLSFGADLLWNPSSLTTLRLVASRQVQDASSTTAAGILATEVKLGVDHELARNLIVSADAGYLRLKPLGTGYNANTWTGRLSARYLMSRRFTLTASLGREDRASFDTTRAYRANSGWLTLGLTL